jgi:hypothetical protein
VLHGVLDPNRNWLTSPTHAAKRNVCCALVHVRAQ